MLEIGGAGNKRQGRVAENWAVKEETNYVITQLCLGMSYLKSQD